MGDDEVRGNWMEGLERESKPDLRQGLSKDRRLFITIETTFIVLSIVLLITLIWVGNQLKETRTYENKMLTL